jgi:ribosomal protein S18 acetylase RimI-like enzyme
MRSAAAVRRLAEEDVQDYRQIRLSALRTTPDAFGSTYDAEAARSDEQHAGRLATSVVFGAYAGDEIVGVVGCKRYDNARELHKAFLWGFYVEPAHRRCGVASGLLTASLRAAPDGVEQILLTVVADNRPAIALYEQFGFRPYGIEPRSLASSGTYVDEMLMVLFLADRTSP